jgi:hypothetical protein
VATPLAGSTSPSEAAGNVEDGWADDEYASDEAQPDEGQAYSSRLPKRRRGLRLVVAIIGLVLVGSAGTAAYRRA